MLRNGPKKSRISAENQNWHGICNPCWHQGWMIRPSHQGVSIMSIAKFQHAAVALVGAFIVASLFVGAAIPVSPIA
jgi:hypothetical protein